MPDRPAPVVTVSVPGGPGRPDRLDAAPTPRLPATGAQRVLVTSAAAILLAGLVVVTGERVEPLPIPVPVAAEPPAPTVNARQTDLGVTAVATDLGLPDDPFVLRLSLAVDVAGSGGPGDSQSPTVDDEVTLFGVSAQGFELSINGVDGPFSLGPAGRDGTTFAFDLDVAVTDCSVPTQAQRRLDLTLRRGVRPEVQVRVATASDVVGRLDRLVARTCRRPRG